MVIKGLDEKSACAGLHDCSPGRVVVTAGYENHPSGRRARTQMCQHFHAGHWVHPDVQNGELDRIRLYVCEKSFRFTEATHGYLPGLEQPGKSLSHRWIIIDKTNGVR